MKKKKVLSIAWQNLKQRRLRTTLTTLGVVIGISLIIAVATLSQGFRGTMKEHIEKTFDLDVLTVRPAGITPNGQEKTSFAEEDVQKIRQIPEIDVATPIRQYLVVTLNNGDRNITAYAVAVNYTAITKVYPNRLILNEGQFPQSSANNSILLGYNVAYPKNNQTFASYNDNVEAEWRWTVPENYSYYVAGVLRETGISETINLDDCVFISLKMYKEIYQNNQFDLVLVKISDPYLSANVATEIENLFQDQVRVTIPLTYLQQSETIFTILEIFLTAVASISMLVAGIGTMNTMTVSVMERTREIGVLKAIGAKNRTILAIFLTEASLIGVMGGLIGIPIGYLLAYGLGYTIPSLMPQLSNYPETIQTLLGNQQSLTLTPVFVPIWICGALIFSIAVSLLFGWYPARRAAKLDPVKALREQ
jgi:putative ABC transport system permease protein